jgi:L-alanine-DL-glutamate epimerase-like enolase superfamily enzyme
MLGGKFRDRIRIYCDTTGSPDPKVFAQRLKERQNQGFTWLKMDLGVTQRGATSPANIRQQYGGPMEHPFMATEITEKGLASVSDFVALVREGLGYEVPLSADHFGSISVNSAIRLGRALTKYNISWLEDLIPWQETALLKQIADAVDIPILTGEDIFLKEPFEVLCREHAVDIIHVDLLTSGGILETKKIGDMAQGYGVPMALHCAHTPIGALASVHAAAATQNFLVLENHAVDVPYWSDLVDGVEKPIVNKGYITVPEKPGLGITLNEAACKPHLMRGEEWFAPTEQWNTVRSNDGLWS